jgi:Tfp pilus assembly protein PilX
MLSELIKYFLGETAMDRTIKNQKGIAMVIALMMLLVMSVMVAGFMLTITNEQRLGGNQVRYVEALNVAEAGISEMAARLNLPNGSTNAIAENVPTYANWEARVLNENNVPGTPTGTHIQYFSTLLAGTANQMNYTVSDMSTADSQYVLTVKYKTNSAGDAIYYYDYGTGTQRLVSGPPFAAPNEKCFPIWVVRSTGMVLNVRRSVEVELTKNKLEINVTAAVASDGGVFATGAFSVCGHNHLMATPGGTRVQEGGHSYPCHDEGWEVCDRDAAGYVADSCQLGGCLPGITTTGDPNEPPNGGGSELGYPVGNSRNGSFKELWEVMGFATEQEMRDAYTIIPINSKSDVKQTYTNSNYGGFFEYRGDMTLDGEGVNELSVSDFPDSCGGILWVRGPFNGVGSWGNANPGVFKGLVYVDGEFVTSNKFWLLGALMVKADTVNYDMVTRNGGPVGRGMHMRGNADLLYSSETLQYVMQQISSESMGLRQLSWREINIH